MKHTTSLSFVKSAGFFEFSFLWGSFQICHILLMWEKVGYIFKNPESIQTLVWCCTSDLMNLIYLSDIGYFLITT